MTMNSTQGLMVTWGRVGEQLGCVRAGQPDTGGYEQGIGEDFIQPVRKPAVRPRPRLLYVYAQPAEGTRRANSAMLTAQHRDATKVMSTTSGEANPAYATTMTRAVMTEAAGATMLVPNAVTRAEPTTPRASPRPHDCQRPCLNPLVHSALPDNGGSWPACSRRVHFALAWQFSLDLIQGSREHGAADPVREG